MFEKCNRIDTLLEVSIIISERIIASDLNKQYITHQNHKWVGQDNLYGCDESRNLCILFIV